MKTITGVIIAKNDEQMIVDALKSMSFCNEIIVIDNGSKDRTRQVAESLNAKVYEIATTDFSELRNYGLSKATCDFVLYVDTDERVSEELSKIIKDVLKKNLEYSAFKIRRKNYYL